ncbi:MAG TPA: hypothetical protein VEU47_03335, partial [Candidatus Cybelea sp.]|nr:hypothetical protein [Candidatus Cybelea sp.]
ENRAATGPSARAAPEAAEEDDAEATIDPAIIGTAKDYQLAVALKRLREMVARGAPGGRS